MSSGDFNPYEKANTPYELFGIECGEGWRPLYTPIIEAALENHISVFQVKEKFGGLRIYLGPAPDWLLDIIENTERLSYHVCEECGKDGHLRSGGWYRTLCDVCYAES